MAKLFIIAMVLIVQAYCSIGDRDEAAHQSHMSEADITDINNANGSDGRNATDEPANEAPTMGVEDTQNSAVEVSSPKPKSSSTHPPLQHEKTTSEKREELTTTPTTTKSASKPTEIGKEKMKPLSENSIGTTAKADVSTKQPKSGHSSSSGLYASFLISVTFTTMALFVN